MLPLNSNTRDKRKRLWEGLQGNMPLRFPGAFSPLAALLIQRLGFEGVYVSGAGIANDLGYPDVGLTTLMEVTERGRAIARVVDLPTIIDIDTGFGGPPEVERAVRQIEDLGLAGCHIEDQIESKRCGHLSNKQLIDTASMIQKIKAAVLAKRDPGFVVIARTDARGPEGLRGAISRAKAYMDAGAQMIFPEALESEREFELLREAISVPLVANMTEFGRSPILSYERLRDLGYNMILYPLTLLRLALKAIEDGLTTLRDSGTHEHLIGKMIRREELYKLLDYEPYPSPENHGGNINHRRTDDV